MDITCAMGTFCLLSSWQMFSTSLSEQEKIGDFHASILPSPN